jgi:N6-L-threonylcarbamoyladenine synthase
MISSKDLNFSFSGLKTAVLYAVLEAEKNSLQNGTLSEEFKAGLAREFEDAVVETLDAKLRKALDVTGAQTIIIGGGVSANKLLREQCTKIAHEYGALLYMPSRHISGDNALMIALAGAFNASSPARTLKAHGTKKLGI